LKIIIGISGKKQSGKSTLAKFLIDKFGYGLCRSYNFADTLKFKIGIDVLGLTLDQCFGTEEQKNSFTDYKWENLPDNIRWKYSIAKDFPILRKGNLTSRELLQIIGTDIFREYFSKNIWIDACFREIEKAICNIVLIADVRFITEIENIINQNGYIIRLTRNIDNKNKDKHSSETELDDYDFQSWGQRCCIINNQNMNISEKNEIALKYVEGILKEKNL
jgi:hypothetical protein